jgi:hypothetical protein
MTNLCFLLAEKKKKWYSISTEQEMVLAENNFFKSGIWIGRSTP